MVKKMNAVEQIGRNIKRIRNELNITQKELADALGYEDTAGKSAISRMERNGVSLNIDRLIDITLFLGVTLDELFRDVEGCEVLFDPKLKEKLTIKKILTEEELECVTLFQQLGSVGKYKAISYLRDQVELENRRRSDDKD